jgi:GcrA cell cycle regulator
MNITDTPTGWTDERVDELKRLWIEGLSCSQIARAIGGCTRNGVIGKIHRLGMSHRVVPTDPDKVQRQPRVQPKRRPVEIDAMKSAKPVVVKPSRPREIDVARSTQATVTPWRVAGPRRAPTPPQLSVAADGPVEPRHFLTRGYGECAWPIGEGEDMLSCCAPVKGEGASYCVAHAAIAYKPEAPRKARDLEKLARRYA